MDRLESIHAYLHLAEDLFSGRISEEGVKEEGARQLPALDLQLLENLAERSEKEGLTQPRRGWAIMAVADAAAATQNADPFLQALSAWYLGRAANDWTQPQRVEEAIRRAQEGFETLDEPGWAAACDWQRYALPWTRNDFNLAVESLEKALEEMERAEMDDFLPHCQLSLAYAQILTSKFDAAAQNIQSSEQAFIARGDALNQARCWLNQASYLRRQAKFGEALEKLEQARSTFDQLDAPVDRAKAEYQIALIHLVKTDYYSKAIDQFHDLAKIFAARNLELWQAFCLNGLGQVFTLMGFLTNAGRSLSQARRIFTRYEIAGLLADNLTDSGRLEILRGRPKICIKHLEGAESLYNQIGNKYNIAIVITNQGEAYSQLGRFQEALHFLEEAATRLQFLGNYSRLAYCEMQLASVWSQLAQPTIAQDYLDKATNHYERVNQEALLTKIYNLRASTLVDQDQTDDVIICLERALVVAKTYKLQPHVALTQRLLGEALSTMGRAAEALQYLKDAEASFAEMEMVMEQAACRVALGDHHARAAEPEAAQAAFEAALGLTGGSMATLDWRAHAGLAALAEGRGDLQDALAAYRRALAAFAKLRAGFWQPALAGSYLQAPARILDRAVTLAVLAESPADALQFIEDAKAQTFLRQLTAPGAFGRADGGTALDDLRAEINWLQDKLRVSFDPQIQLQTSAQVAELRARLVEKAEQYDALASRLERREGPAGAGDLAHQRFSLDRFRRLAGESLGESWIALDYYLTGEELTMVMVTPSERRVWRSPVSVRAEMALEICALTRRTGKPPRDSDLLALGGLLLPDGLEASLTPETYLLIAPHGDLHQVPWGAVALPSSSQSLVTACLPVVTPSLHGLSLLWQRGGTESPMVRGAGLLLGLSDFQGRRPALPAVVEEVSNLAPHLGPQGVELTETDATWSNLKWLSRKAPASGLSRFAWMHLASHISYDPRTGRLSSLILHDGEVWLDQLRDLAPLPRLVTLSACNGTQSLIYEGDEPVGLPSTCLIAGAGSVVGSLWPVSDTAALSLMGGFYTGFLAGASPARALAQAQRQASTRGEEILNWASFVCIGIP